MRKTTFVITAVVTALVGVACGTATNPARDGGSQPLFANCAAIGAWTVVAAHGGNGGCDTVPPLQQDLDGSPTGVQLQVSQAGTVTTSWDGQSPIDPHSCDAVVGQTIPGLGGSPWDPFEETGQGKLTLTFTKETAHGTYVFSGTYTKGAATQSCTDTYPITANLNVLPPVARTPHEPPADAKTPSLCGADGYCTQGQACGVENSQSWCCPPDASATTIAKGECASSDGEPDGFGSPPVTGACPASTPVDCGKDNGCCREGYFCCVPSYQPLTLNCCAL